MTREQVLSELQLIFQDAFLDNELQINEETTAADIEDWDSLMQVTLISAIEKKYQKQFMLEDVLGLENVGDMVTLILQDENL